MSDTTHTDTPETDRIATKGDWVQAGFARGLERERNQLRELRKGDFELTKALAAAAGITITASDQLPGAQWEQFDKGVMRLAKECDKYKTALQKIWDESYGFDESLEIAKEALGIE